MSTDDISRIFDKLDELKTITNEHISKSEIFRTECSRNFCDINDQIKGAPEKHIQGIYPAITEMDKKHTSNTKELQNQITDLNKVSIIQLTVRKQLKKLTLMQWLGIIAIVGEAIAEGIFKTGVLSFLSFVVKHIPNF